MAELSLIERLNTAFVNLQDHFRKPSDALNHEDFVSYLENYVVEEIRHYWRQTHPDHQPLTQEQVREVLSKKPDRNVESMKAHLIRSHRLWLSAWTTISNVDRRTIWAESNHHRRIFLFRVITAMSMAAVIMGTYYLAEIWGVHLPLLSRIPL